MRQETPGEGIWGLFAEQQRDKVLKSPVVEVKLLKIATIGYLGFSTRGKEGSLGLVVEKGQVLTDHLVLRSVLDTPYKTSFFYYHIKPLIDKLDEKDLTWLDLLFVPGHGTLHPRGYGVACEIADQLEIPVAGIARESIHEINGYTSEDEYLSLHSGKKLQSTSGKTVYISIGGHCSLDQLIPLVFQRLKPNGWLEGFQQARNLARQAWR
ncbi:MAG: endonuclease V [Candidatus Odinarchaeota archaeon]